MVPNTTLVSRNAQSYYSPQAPSTAVGVTECLVGTGLNVRTVTLNKPILGLTLHINNLDASYVDIVQQFPGGYRLDKVKSNVSLQLQNSGTRIRNAVPMGTATCSDDAAATNNPGCGSFRLSQNDGPVSRFTFRNTPVGAGNDGWYWSLSFHEASLTKAFTPSTVTAGATSALSITVTNPGTEGAIPLSGVSFADSLPTGLTLADSAVTTTGCGAAAVNGGEPVAGQTSVDVTDATIAAGGTCVVTVNVTSAQPGTYTNNNSNITTSVGNIVPNADATLEVVPRAALGLEKRASTPVDVNANGITDAGDTIQYSFDLTNTGDATLSDLAVDDPKAGAVACPASVLSAGRSQTCTANEPYTVTVADVENGSVDNDATATGTSPTGQTITSLVSSTSTPTTAPAPALSVVKSANVQQITAVGQVVAYSFVVSNTGNVILTNPTINEGAFTGNGELSPVECPAGVLTPGASITCTATYTVVTADLSGGGELSNTATASATTPAGGSIISTASTAAVDVAPPAPAPAGGLAVTGGTVAWSAAGLALMLIVAGGVIAISRRRSDSISEV